MIVPPSLGVYIHMPWCVRKCPYCDFNSHVAPTEIPERRYVDALLQDLEHDLQWVQSRAVESIFLGGGTPSLFSPEAVAELIAGIHARVACVSDLEVTLEANPGTIERGRFAGYRAAGITRVSLGVQSFKDRHLHALGRIHQGADAERAVTDIREAGFDNYNLDLMYGLPAQTVGEALEDVEQALRLEPTHLSHYQLTLEPGTVFYHRPPAALPDDEVACEIQNQSAAILADHGLGSYEISAYARSQAECRHNLNYWRFGDYLGLGAGAHGKLSDTEHVWRTERRKQPREYLESPTPERRMLATQAVKAELLPFEFMLNALRLHEGFTSAQFEERTGVKIATIDARLAEAEQRGLLARRPGGWRPTELGTRFLNDLQGLFLG